MLIEFTVENYRSFRDKAVLSMEATGLSTLKSILIPFGGMRILPSVAIYGKNMRKKQGRWGRDNI